MQTQISFSFLKWHSWRLIIWAYFDGYNLSSWILLKTEIFGFWTVSHLHNLFVRSSWSGTKFKARKSMTLTWQPRQKQNKNKQTKKNKEALNLRWECRPFHCSRFCQLSNFIGHLSLIMQNFNTIAYYFCTKVIFSFYSTSILLSLCVYCFLMKAYYYYYYSRWHFICHHIYCTVFYSISLHEVLIKIILYMYAKHYWRK